MSFLTGTILLAIVVSLACALPGVFIVLRKNSMLVDAMSHSVLPGIVLGYYFVHNLESPLLILGATIAALLVVAGNEYLMHTGLVCGDAPQGLVFPALFSLGVILISLDFHNIHLDVHAVLVGDLNLVAQNQLIIGGFSFGPSYMYVLLGLLLINALLLAAGYRMLQITTFDLNFALSQGLPATLVNSVFMFVTAFTVTASFHAAGAILVTALIVVPPATAFLVSRRLSTMVWLSCAFAVFGSLGGFWIAYELNAATSAGIAVFHGVVFCLVFAVQRAQLRRNRRSHLAKPVPELASITS